MAAGELRDGNWNAGMRINISKAGMRNTKASPMKKCNQYTNDETPDTRRRWRIPICGIIIS